MVIPVFTVTTPWHLNLHWGCFSLLLWQGMLLFFGVFYSLMQILLWEMVKSEAKVMAEITSGFRDLRLESIISAFPYSASWNRVIKFNLSAMFQNSAALYSRGDSFLSVMPHAPQPICAMWDRSAQSANYTGLVFIPLILGMSEMMLFSNECTFLMFRIRSPMKSDHFSSGGFLFASFLWDILPKRNSWHHISIVYGYPGRWQVSFVSWGRSHLSYRSTV